jgi:murein L,D-transpeptidase YcbB/YkuD
MVGAIRTQTPIFRADMSYLEFNPTWTVPRSIIRKSLYGKFAADPNYISEHQYKLYSSDGAEVDPQSLDWSQYSANRFPFRVVQQPGPGNALGRVKFMFPNKYAVYLHDTPSKALFSRTARAFSHGCVRVRDPMHFASLLLADESGWNRERIDQVVDSEERTVVRFGDPVDIMLMYWTTGPDLASGIKFHPDIYSRDPRSLELLKEKPRWSVY